MRGGCDEAEVWMRRIPKLGCNVDVTKPAWRFDRLLMRSKFEAWIRILDFLEVYVTKPALKSTKNQLLLHIQMRSDARNSQAPNFEDFGQMRI